MNGQNSVQTPTQVMLSEEVRKGRYANTVNINVYQDEAIVDFILMSPNQGHGETVSRIVISNHFLEELAKLFPQLAAQLKKQTAPQAEPISRQIGFQGQPANKTTALEE